MRKSHSRPLSAQNAVVSGLEAATADPSSALAMKQLSKAESTLGSAMGSFNLVMEASATHQ
ncbi:MAG: LemA protein [Candidatus Endobugula sp.]|jgi:LemA protein